MDLKKIGKAVAGVAPALATALGGPLAGVAAGAIARAVLGKDTADAAELDTALRQLTPEQSAALYQADREFKRELARIDLRRDELVVEDRSSARTRDVAYVQAGRHNLRGDVLAFGALSLLGGFVLLVFFGEIPDQGPARDIMFALSTGLIGLANTVFAFEFGSSRGSEHKTTLLERKP